MFRGRDLPGDAMDMVIIGMYRVGKTARKLITIFLLIVLAGLLVLGLLTLPLTIPAGKEVSGLREEIREAQFRPYAHVPSHRRRSRIR